MDDPTRMRHRPKRLPRYQRMTRGYGYLCPLCREPIMYDRQEKVYFCWHTECNFRETRDEYKHTLRDIKTTLDRKEIIRQSTLEKKRADEAAAKAKASRENKGVVYYVQFRDAIKIGTTVDLAGRMAVIPWESVLAIEPGGYEVEHRRHRQFTKHHLQLEWFLQCDELMAHVDDLNRQHADWVKATYGDLPEFPWRFNVVSLPGFAA